MNPTSPSALLAVFLVCAALFASGCGHSDLLPATTKPPASKASDPAEQVVGERLFLETRFAQFFATHSSADVNAPLRQGDATMDSSVTTTEPLAGPYAGRSMNCAACHLVDQQDGVLGGGLRTYTDFARRSPIPDRGDGRATAPRNSPPLVDSIRANSDAPFLHLDGEFTNGVDLVAATLTGRNYGWLANERATAVAHIARIVREDDGTDPLAVDCAQISYRRLLDPMGDVPSELTIPARFRVDVLAATDEEILTAVARLVDAYMRGLQFQRDDADQFSGSPYDSFLAKNDLPRAPSAHESDADYSRRLRALVAGLVQPKFVTEEDGSFAHHSQAFRFGAEELAGLELFLSTPDVPRGASVANCVACHPAPRFSDDGFHSVGTAQEEFDALHGEGSFASLFVPSLAERSSNPDAYLPPSNAHPFASGVFLRVPSLREPQQTDLGLWNVFANADVPKPQAALRALLRRQFAPNAETDDDGQLLTMTIGLFKTPRLRDLADSAPYMHTGRFDALEDVLAHYRRFSDLARAGWVRNADPGLARIEITPLDSTHLVAFLRSLNEDYD